MYKKYKYQGWKGGFVAHYFGHLEEGKWVEISYLKYLWLKFNGYTVRKVKENELKNGDNILITKLPSCINVPPGTPNPYIGMSGEVRDLRDGVFHLYTGSSWLCNVNVKGCKFERI